MAEIKKLDLYVNKDQYRKLCLLADQKGVEPEQIANESIYSYLAIVDPFAKELEPEEGMHEIRFEIPEEAADQIMEFIPLEGYDDLDKYAKDLLLGLLGQLQP